MRRARLAYWGTALAVAAVGAPPRAAGDGLEAVPCRAVDAAAQRELGRALFFEPALSESGTISCATCHQAEHAFADRRRFSLGQAGEPLRRNTPTVLNRPSVGFQFWDGRALSLAAQVAHPLETPEEMGRSIAQACGRVAALPAHSERFRAAFGSSEVTPCRLSAAIAAFVASLRATESDYERARRLGRLPEAVARGQALFAGAARCATCHKGPDFTDERFHNTGIAWKSGSGDLGRGALTGRTGDLRAVKTPTLREVAGTAPYMHDGSIPTLEEVVRHYAQGGAPEDPSLDPSIKPLELSPEQIADLLAFLRACADSRAVPSALASAPSSGSDP
jgi:cytochrome c peroxidase